MFLEAFDVRRIEVDGSPEEGEDAHKVFNAEIWMEGDINYIFSFEGDFYSCQRTDWNKTEDSGVVEEGTASGLEDLSVENISDFCVEQAKLFELDRGTNENYEGIDSLSLGVMKVYDTAKRNSPVSKSRLKDDLMKNSRVDVSELDNILENLKEIGLVEVDQEGMLKA